MLPLREKDRVRILSAVARKGAPFHALRVTAISGSLLILLAVPLLGIVRLDLWGGHHLVLGERVSLIDGLKGFILAMAGLYGVTFLSNMVVGRFFCGWGCPVGYVSRLGEEVELQKRNAARRLLHHALGAAFVATFVGAVMLWWVDPRVVIDGSWTARAVTLGVFLFLCGGGFMHAFRWRFGFCLGVCPIGLYYRYVTSNAPVTITFTEVPDPCIACGSCETVCPVDLDPKHLGESLVRVGADGEAVERYGDAECIRCGDCVEACRLVFSKHEGAIPPLRFGRASERAAKVRAGSGAREPGLPVD